MIDELKRPLMEEKSKALKDNINEYNLFVGFKLWVILYTVAPLQLVICLYGVIYIYIYIYIYI